MRHLSVACALAWCLSAVAAPVPKAVKKQTDAERIVGVWVEADNPKAVWFFNADGTAGVGEPDKPSLKAIYKMDEAQTPPHFDWSQGDQCIENLNSIRATSENKAVSLAVEQVFEKDAQALDCVRYAQRAIELSTPFTKDPFNCMDLPEISWREEWPLRLGT